MAQKWLDCSYTLRGSPEPAKIIQDWVLEMWGWSIAAASVGVKHKIVPSFQIEPNAYARTAEDVLWRRNKLGLRLSEDEVARLDRWMGARRRAAAAAE